MAGQARLMNGYSRQLGCQEVYSVKEMKLAYYGHLLRKKGDCLEMELIQGTTPGSRTRGRPKMTWIDNIKSWTGLSLTELTRTVEDGHQWRKIVHGVANPHSEDAKGRQAGSLVVNQGLCIGNMSRKSRSHMPTGLGLMPGLLGFIPAEKIQKPKKTPQIFGFPHHF